MLVPEILKHSEYFSVGDYNGDRFRMVFNQLLETHSLKSLTPVWSRTLNKDFDKLVPGLDVAKIYTILSEKFNFKQLSMERNSGSRNYYLYNDYAIMNFNVYKDDKSLELNFTSLNNELFEEINNEIKTWFIGKQETYGKIFLLEVTHDQLLFKDVGTVGATLIRDNYAPKVTQSFDYLAQELAAKDPRGRLVILNGPPGGGKTFFIRGLAQETKGVLFALIMPHQISALTNPNTIPALLNLRNQYPDKGIVFIIEDGDTLIVPRDSGNMNEIAQLLNLSDGLLGSLLDLKFIVSTNADHLEIDDAIKRPGRMMRHVGFDALSFEQSAQIYTRLTGKDPVKAGLEPNKSYLLTNIYALTRETQTNFDIKPKKLGFNS
jgi:hypothetical protein